MKRRRVPLLLLVAVLAVLGGALLDDAAPLRKLELKTIDARFHVRGDQKPRSDVVIVAIDDKTLGAYKEGIPVNRNHHAEVIKRLLAAGAKVIAYDVQFTQPSDDEKADNALVDAVEQGKGHIVLGTTEVEGRGQTQIFGGGEILQQIGAVPAATALLKDRDGAVRRLPFKVHGLESFALAAARMQRGAPVATPAGTNAPIDYAGPTGTIPTLSQIDIEQGRFSPSQVRGKVVVVGVTAVVSQDIHRTPVDDFLPGVEIQAESIATALDDFPLHHTSGLVDWLVLIALGAIAPLLSLRFRATVVLLATLAAVAACLIAAQVAFDAGAILTVVPALFAAGLGLIGALIVAPPKRAPWFDRLLDRLTGARGNQRTRRVRGTLLLGAAAAIVLGVAGLQAADALRRPDLSSVDKRFSIRGKQAPPSDIVIVGIDEQTFTTPPKPTWPFNRADHAKVIRNLLKAGAKVIAYDVQFTEQSPDPDADEKLVEAVRSGGRNRIVMASTEIRPDGSTDIFGGQSGQLAYSHAVPAFSVYPFDVDGRDRRMLFHLNGLESFDVAAARLMRGRKIDLPPGDSAWVDYAGPPFSVKEISFVDVKTNKFDPAAVKGKLVIVGATASVLQDIHPTSTSGNTLMPGPEIHANGMETALRNFPLRSGPGWLNLVLVFVLGALTPLAALRLGIFASVAIGATAIAGLLVGAQLLFNAGTIISVVYAGLAGVLAILATAAIHGVTVAFEREQTRDAFARFVPESVVDQVLKNADGVRLGGVRREGTVMFSDLRGFTSFSESLEPEQVIEALNMYLTEMSEAILDHGGTLVAYMGDGIMAVFGAPLQQPDHADRALEAARDMLSRMEKFNNYLREKELNEGGFKMGIGLNSGPVMSGNVGSERRLEYTALGDTTNTAARLEGMTKGTPHQLFVSDTTREMLTRPAEDLIEVGEAEVRGRVAKVMLWSLADQPAPPPETHTPAAQPVEAGDAEHPLPPVG